MQLNSTQKTIHLHVQRKTLEQLAEQILPHSLFPPGCPKICSGDFIWPQFRSTESPFLAFHNVFKNRTGPWQREGGRRVSPWWREQVESFVMWLWGVCRMNGTLEGGFLALPLKGVVLSVLLICFSCGKYNIFSMNFKTAQHITLHIASFSLLQLLQFWSCPPILFFKIAFSVPHDTYFLIMGRSSFMYKNEKWCYIPNYIQGQFSLKMQFAKCWHDNCIESSLLGLFLQTGLLCMAIWRLSNLKPNYIQMNAPRRPVVQQQ